MTPKYAVGEEVILCSKCEPELNGRTCVVLDIQFGTRLSAYSGKVVTGLGYMLEISGVDSKDWWAESALRKKHKPADESFTQMIDRLNRETV